MSTQVTEGRYKSAVKTKARKTNNQASFGGSLLQNNMGGGGGDRDGVAPG